MFPEAGNLLRLTTALRVYGSAVATVHQPIVTNGRITLGKGTPLTEEALRDLIRTVQPNAPLEIFPEALLLSRYNHNRLVYASHNPTNVVQNSPRAQRQSLPPARLRLGRFIPEHSSFAPSPAAAGQPLHTSPSCPAPTT